MRHTLTLLFVSAFILFSNAQSAFEKNNQAITIGYGLPNIYKSLVTQQLQSEDADIKSRLKQQGSTFTYSASGLGPLFFKYEYAVSSKIGLGVAIGYHNIAVTETYSYQRFYYSSQTQVGSNRSFYQAITRSSKSISIGARFNYHFGERTKVDPYVGFAVGYNHSVLTESYTTNDPDLQPQADSPGYLPVPVYVAATMGMRAYLSKSIGVYLELGFDKWSLIQGGLAFKVP